MTTAADQDLVRCPTCTATQPAAAECRRCKCDLTLYVAALAQCRMWKQRTLQALHHGRYDEALEAAYRYANLSPDRDAGRWIAIAHLLRGDFAAARARGSGFRPVMCDRTGS
jgi:hypothetical protein